MTTQERELRGYIRKEEPKIVVKNYSRRYLLASAAATGVATLFAVGGRRTITTEGVVTTPTLPPPISELKSVERGKNPDLLSIEEEPGVRLNQKEIDAIEKTWNRFEAFEPASHVHINKEGALTEVVGDDISFNAQLFSDDPDMGNRQSVEIPMAILMSIPTRIVSEARDGRKLLALGTFMEQYEDLKEKGTQEEYNLGTDLFNLYRSWGKTYSEDKDRGKYLLTQPTGFFASVASSLALNIDSVKSEIMAMPKVTQSSYGMYPGENVRDSSTDEVDSTQRSIAKKSIRLTYNLLKTCSQKKGEVKGDASLVNAVQTAFPGISVLRFDLELRQ